PSVSSDVAAIAPDSAAIQPSRAHRRLRRRVPQRSITATRGVLFRLSPRDRGNSRREPPFATRDRGIAERAMGRISATATLATRRGGTFSARSRQVALHAAAFNPRSRPLATAETALRRAIAATDRKSVV